MDDHEKFISRLNGFGLAWSPERGAYTRQVRYSTLIVSLNNLGAQINVVAWRLRGFRIGKGRRQNFTHIADCEKVSDMECVLQRMLDESKRRGRLPRWWHHAPPADRTNAIGGTGPRWGEKAPESTETPPRGRRRLP